MKALDAGTEGCDPAHYLVSWHERQAGFGEIAINHVEICAADAARGHANQDFSRTGLGNRPLFEGERLPDTPEHHRAHRRAVHRGELSVEERLGW